MLYACLILLLKRVKLPLVTKKNLLCLCVKMGMDIWRSADSLKCQSLPSAWPEASFLVLTLHARWPMNVWEFSWLPLPSHRSTEITEELNCIWHLHRFWRVRLRPLHLCSKEFTHCTG